MKLKVTDPSGGFTTIIEVMTAQYKNNSPQITIWDFRNNQAIIRTSSVKAASTTMKYLFEFTKAEIEATIDWCED